MNRIKSLIAVGAFSLLVLGIPAIASAQYGQYGQYDPYGRNGGYNNGGYNNGNYGNNGYYGDIRGALRDLKQRSNDFHREIDRGTGGIFGGLGRNNNDRYLRDLANNFRKAADHLENHYNDRDQYRAQNDAREVLALGSQLGQEINRMRGNRYLDNQWRGIDNDLRIVANMYGSYNNNNRNNRGYNPNNGGNYPNNGGYYPNNGGYYPPNNGRYNRPSWWPF